MRDTVITAEDCLLNVWENANKTLPLTRMSQRENHLMYQLWKIMHDNKRKTNWECKMA